MFSGHSGPAYLLPKSTAVTKAAHSDGMLEDTLLGRARAAPQRAAAVASGRKAVLTGAGL
jgi:hypothetical protein